MTENIFPSTYYIAKKRRKYKRLGKKLKNISPSIYYIAKKRSFYRVVDKKIKNNFSLYLYRSKKGVETQKIGKIF